MGPVGPRARASFRVLDADPDVRGLAQRVLRATDGIPRTCGIHVDGTVDGGGGQQVGLGGVERDPRQGAAVRG